MNRPAPAKRRRIITACQECYRRKQKCDRGRPCNICISRNVPEKCSYGNIIKAELVSESAKEEPHLSHKEPTRQEEHVAQESLPSDDLPRQAGYFALNNSNAFMGLRESFPAGWDLPGNQIESRYSFSTHEKNLFRSLVAGLPPDPIAKDLISIFFTEVNWFVFALERHYFERLHASWIKLGGNICADKGFTDLSRDLHCFPALLFQVFAVALQFLPLKSNLWSVLELDDSVTCDKLSSKYSDMGMAIMSLLGRHDPTLTAVQHDLMRALWLKNCSRGTESWHILGTAIRQAQELGLYLQCDIPHAPGGDVGKTLEAVWYDEYKRRLWISLFNWDSHMAVTLGRARTINAADCTIKRPLDCDLPDDPSNAVPSTNWSGRPSSYSKQLFQFDLSHKMHKMLSLGAGRRHFKDYDAVQSLHDEVIALLDELPPIARPEEPDTSWDLRMPDLPKLRYQITCAANSFLIALHRPHTTTHIASRQAATLAALRTLDSQQRLFELVREHHYKLFGLCFYTIDAAIFLLATLITFPPEEHSLQQEIHSALYQAINRLALMRERNAMAKSGEHILRRCFQNIPEPSLRGELLVNKDPQQPEELVETGANFPSRNATFTSWLGALDVGQFPAQESDDSIRFDPFSNQTDFDESFWLDQMNQILGVDPTASISDSRSNGQLNWLQ